MRASAIGSQSSLLPNGRLAQTSRETYRRYGSGCTLLLSFGKPRFCVRATCRPRSEHVGLISSPCIVSCIAPVYASHSWWACDIDPSLAVGVLGRQVLGRNFVKESTRLDRPSEGLCQLSVDGRRVVAVYPGLPDHANEMLQEETMLTVVAKGHVDHSCNS